VEIVGVSANGDHSAALSGKSITLPLHGFTIFLNKITQFISLCWLLYQLMEIFTPGEEASRALKILTFHNA
jgi:hypothetical protein